MKLVKGARNAIKSNAINNHNQPHKEAVLKLISDLRNVPNHVFGKHENCGIFCKRNIEIDNTDCSVMQSSGLMNAIQYEIGKTLVACSNNLIGNATNNPAETFMSQLCKLSRGKRINFSKSGGFNRRANIAVLAFQSPAQQFHEKACKRIAKKSPSTSLTKFLSCRRNRYLKQIQRRKLFPNSKKLKSRQYATDYNYGENVDRPDVPKQIYDNLTENHLF
ncbi:yqaJ domain-containing protein [Trichonephila clavata]|uniref:YqaJ domain-containing protein n=1 Tax=Trichonephila clavata TaxID=2740835 RepID=A0A8X6HXB7_TRICU|nr:yqaJ domain-containing protein [Trichonephila clavata]